MRIGYACVSASQDPDPGVQRSALAEAGCETIFEDHVGGKRDERLGLEQALESLVDGDTLVVWKLDRLGQSIRQLVYFVGDLRRKGIQFRSISDAIDTGTPSGQMFFHVMASLADMDHELIVERNRTGLEAARQLGRKGGRKPKMTDSKIASAKSLLANGMPPKDVAKSLGVSIPTLYRWVPAAANASSLISPGRIAG